MKSAIGQCIELSLFGESHGEAIGVVIQGLPSGIRIDEAAGTVRVEKGVPDSVRLTLVYTLDGTGALAVAYDLQIAGQLPEPLRAGLRTRVPNTLGRMAYFGKGPQENYSDRSCGALLGVRPGTSCTTTSPRRRTATAAQCVGSR